MYTEWRQWYLRQQFMLAYKPDTIPEDELVRRTRVYENIETYQRRYSVEVMDQVEKLAVSLPVDAGRQQYVTGPKSRIVFVKEGSNATVSSNNNTGSEERLENRKRKGTSLDEGSGHDVCNTQHLKSGMTSSNQFVHKLPREYQLQSFQGHEHKLSQKSDKSDPSLFGTSSYTGQKQDVTSAGNYDEDIKQNMTHFNNFVIVIDENVNMGTEQMLQECGAFNKLRCRFKNTRVKNCDSGKRYIVEFEGVPVGEGSSFKMKEAKRLAANSALMNLSQVANTLIVKANIADPNNWLTKMSLGVAPEQERNCSTDGAISESNVGHRMLRLMGWTGGGLGRIGNEGITEPIKAAAHQWSRKGLGLPQMNGANKLALKKFRQRITTVLREFSSTSIDNVLVVSTEFNKEERALIHGVCWRFNLHCTSRHSKEKGGIYLTIRHMSPNKLKRHALLNGGLSDKYEVLPPGSSWPRITKILKLDKNFAETTKEDIKPVKKGQDVGNTEFLHSGINLSDQLVQQLQGFQGYEHKLSRYAENCHLMSGEVSPKKSESLPLTAPCYTEQKEDVTSAGNYDKDIKQNMTQFNNFVIVIDENVLHRGIEPMFKQCGKFNKLRCRLKNEVINKCGSDKRYVVEFDKVVVGEGVSGKLEDAKRQAAKSALMNLSLVAFTLIVKVNIEDRNKRLTKMSLGLVPEEEEGNCITNKPLSDSNVGDKMLRLMEWSEGGLGPIGNERITEPIKDTTQKWSLNGLCLQDSDDANKFPVTKFEQRITAVLRDFSSTSIDNVLVFSTEFNTEERVLIHDVCRRFNLYGASRGNSKTGNRCLTIRHMSPDQLMRRALLHGGLSDKYEVLPPGSSWPRINEILKFDSNLTETTKDGITPLKTAQGVCNTEYLNSGMHLSDHFAHNQPSENQLQRFQACVHKLSPKAERFHLMSGEVLPIKSDLPPSTTCYTEQKEDLTSAGSYDEDIKPNMTQFNNFVIVIDENDSHRGIEPMLKQCGKFNKLRCCFKNEVINNCGSDKRYAIEFDGVVFGECSSFAMKEAKRQVAKSTLMKLSLVAYTLIVKANIDEPYKRVTKMSLGLVPEEEEGNCTTDNAISENNVGYKMLCFVGWSDGGLGRIGNGGITKPIEDTTQKQSHREPGLPDSDGANKFALKQFREKITAVVKEFSSTSIDNVLVFSTEFTKKENLIIHGICKSFNLHITSGGDYVKGDHYLTIRHMSPDELKWHALLHGGLSDKYEVLPPGSSWPRIKEIFKLD